MSEDSDLRIQSIDWRVDEGLKKKKQQLAGKKGTEWQTAVDREKEGGRLRAAPSTEIRFL
jgi:hypothetical protein